jgi:pimeloyl-ACP methyl ester carboxylesterase
MRELDAGEGLTGRGVRLPDGRGLRVVQGGAGQPLVALEAGGGACASEWTTVQRAVAAHTRTLAYDRAGYGGSDPDPRPRTVTNMARDLADLLDALGEKEPVVLVAHSWGGPILRSFALDAPDRVAGLVFVDCTVSELMTARDARVANTMATLVAAITKLGIPNPMGRMLAATFGPDVPPEDRALMLRDFTDRQAAATFRRETREIAPALARLKDWEGAGLPDVPVTSVVGGMPSRGQQELRAALIEHERAEMARHHGTLVVVDGAGHYVPQQQPAHVARAILDLVQRVRTAVDSAQ